MAIDRIASIVAGIGNLALQEQQQHRQTIVQLAFEEKRDRIRADEQRQAFARQLHLQDEREDALLERMKEENATQIERQKILSDEKFTLEKMKNQAEAAKRMQEAKELGIAAEAMQAALDSGQPYGEASIVGGIAALRQGQRQTGEKLIALGKPQTAGSAAKIKENLLNANSTAKQLFSLTRRFFAIPETFRGPIQGRILGNAAKFLGLSGDLNTYDDFKKFFAARMVKEFGGQSGVLSNQEVQHALGFFPDKSDSDDAATKKLEQMWETIDLAIRDKQKISGMESTGLTGIDFSTNFTLPENLSEQSISDFLVKGETIAKEPENQITDDLLDEVINRAQQ